MTTKDLSHTTTAHKKAANKTTADFSTTTTTPTDYKLRFPQFARKPKENTTTDDDDDTDRKVSYLY